MTHSSISRSGFARTFGAPVGCCLLWLKDEALEESANLPAPDVIVSEIVQDLEAALEQFREIEEDLKPEG